MRRQEEDACYFALERQPWETRVVMEVAQDRWVMRVSWASDREAWPMLYRVEERDVQGVPVQEAMRFDHQAILLRCMADERDAVVRLVHYAHRSLDNSHLEVVTRTSLFAALQGDSGDPRVAPTISDSGDPGIANTISDLGDPGIANTISTTKGVHTLLDGAAC